MSDAHTTSQEHKPHILPVRTYATVFVALVFLTWLTVRVSYLDFGIFNMIVGVGIATLKAFLVVLFFMHMKYDEKFNWIVFSGCIGFLAVFFVLTLADTMERGRVDPIEEHQIEPVPARPELLEMVGEHDGHGEAEAHGEAGTPAGREGETAPPTEGETATPTTHDASPDEETPPDSGAGGH